MDNEFRQRPDDGSFFRQNDDLVKPEPDAAEAERGMHDRKFNAWKSPRKPLFPDPRRRR
jgi:hypothetical protein